MSAPTPAEESLELYNDLVRTSPGDKETVQRILWRSRKLERQMPTNFRVRVLLTIALATAEEPAQALSAVDGIGDLWKGQQYEPTISFLVVLVGLWDLDRTKQIVNMLLEVHSLRGDRDILECAVQCAVGLGDLEWLTNLSGLEKEIPNFHEAENTLSVIKESGLVEHFRKHQQLVRQHVAGRACFTGHMVVGEEDDAPLITTNIFAAADRKECRRIENEISESLADYYESQGLPAGVYIPYFATIISPLTTAPPLMST